MRLATALRRWVALAAVGVAIVGVVVLRGQAGESGKNCGFVGGSPGARYAANAGMPCTRTATVIGEVNGHVEPGGGTDGTVIGDARSSRQVEVVMLGEPVSAGETQWVHVYVPTYGSGAGDRDVFTWLPLSIDGRPTLTDPVEAACPPTRDNLSTLGILDPMTRARCLGSHSVTVTGAVGGQAGAVSYDVDPAWLSGVNGAPSGFSIRNEPYGEPIDVQSRSEVDVPPIGFVIELTMHAGDPAARSCLRTANTAEDPVERREDSARWCASRIVADHWIAKLGPEGRPIDRAHPQLHRIQASSACAGVNSGPMKFRMDPTALDPVWLEGTGGYRLIPWFADRFQPAFQPDLVILNGAGVVIARDGDEINPNNGSMTGAYLCATGRGVTLQ